MKTHVPRLIVIACAIFLAVGCKPKHNEIKGQVYVVLKNGETIKLSVAEVLLYDALAMRTYLTNALRQASADMLRLNERHEAAIKERDSLFQANTVLRGKRANVVAEEDALKSKQDAAKQRAQLVRNNKEALDTARAAYYEAEKQASELVDSRLKLNSEIAKNETAVNQLKAEIKNLDEMIRDFDPNNDIFRGLPPPRTTCRTDADGRFFFKVPADQKFWVVAQAARSVLENEEKYFWIVPADGEQVLLNNANFFSGSRLMTAFP